MCLHLAALTRDSIQFDMKHKHVLKKLNFVLLTPPPVSGGSTGKNICYHPTTCVIPLNLICNMSMF